MNRITVGSWRDDRNGPMQVVSGPIGKEHVRFEAPPAAKVAAEMDAFLTWFNRETENDWVVKAPTSGWSPYIRWTTAVPRQNSASP